jgi:hypothetical protein
MRNGVGVILPFDEQEHDDAATDGRRQAGKIDERRKLVFEQTAPGDFEVVFEHGVAPFQLSVFSDKITVAY